MSLAHERTPGVGCQVSLSSGDWSAAFVMYPWIREKGPFTSSTSEGGREAGGCCLATTTATAC
jgi:hypothetical protein